MSIKYFTLPALILGLYLGSCNKHNRPDEPSPKVAGNEALRLPATHTIAQLKALYVNGPRTITEPIVIEATMASDDTEGNLYRSAYIQDATGGMELKLSLGNLSTLYPQGSKIKLLAQGMTLGNYAGQINLGYRSLEARYETAYLPEKLIPQVLHKSTQGTLTPETITLSTISKSYAGKLIRLEGVQFLASELGQTWADPTNKQANGNVNRTLQDRSGKTIIVRTSSYSRFAGATLPEGSGNITAILSYFRETPQLILLRERDAELWAPRF